jgi:hypothetical protein
MCAEAKFVADRLNYLFVYLHKWTTKLHRDKYATSLTGRTEIRNSGR